MGCARIKWEDSPVTCNDGFAGDTCDDEVESCGLLMDWDVECILAGNGPQAGLDCESPLLGYVQCVERPTAATMLFTGGGCEQGDNTQSSSEYTCTDSNSGPPFVVGEEAFIIVTDIKGDGITYFSGPVSVGETFSLNDGNELFETDMFIMIYTPDQQTLLQTVQFRTSCSSALYLLDRFGAAQLVGFFNDLQGGVSVSTVYLLALTFNVPADADFDPTEFTSMTAETSWAGEVDWTDRVADQVIAPGGASSRPWMPRPFHPIRPRPHPPLPPPIPYPNGVTVTQVGFDHQNAHVRACVCRAGFNVVCGAGGSRTQGRPAGVSPGRPW